MKRSEYTSIQSTRNALKCLASIVAVFALIGLGVNAYLYQHGFALALCWIAAMAAIVSSVHFGAKAAKFQSQAFIAQFREMELTRPRL